MPSIASCEIKIDSKAMQAQLDKVGRKLDDDIAIIFDVNAAWGEAWMKLNAPWTDDTGAARSGLTAIANSNESLHTMLLSYSVSYGIWLEIANSGKFQILGPAMRVIANKIMQDLNGILDGAPPDLRPPTLDIAPIARKAKPVTNKSGNRSSRKKYGQRRNTQ